MVSQLCVWPRYIFFLFFLQLLDLKIGFSDAVTDGRGRGIAAITAIYKKSQPKTISSLGKTF